MSTDATPHPRKGNSASLVLLLIVAAGGIYVGVRWHSTFERWLVPSAASQPAQSRDDTPRDKKQLWTCGMHPQVIQDHPGDCPICHMKLTPMLTAGESPSQGNTTMVAIDPTVVQNMGIRTAEVTEGPLSQTVRVSAMVNEAESDHRDVNLRVSGWIQTLYANTDGMEVKKGDPLFDLYSPDLRLAIEELISAHRAVSTEGGAALGDTGTSLVAAAESRLLALGLTSEQISELGGTEHAPHTVTIVSPINGHITDKAEVYTGSAVMMGQRVFRIAERTTMWIEGRVPEGEIARVRIGQKTSVKIDAFPGRTFAGEVIFIHPHFDEATRTALVRTALTNHDHALHQGMFATIDIDVGEGESVVLVPREAIIDTGESQVVFVSMGKGRFEPRKVVMGRGSTHGLVQVISGLKSGEKVVASGQFLLDSESRLREAIAKFLDQKPAVASEPASPPVAPPAVTKTITVSPAKVDAIVAAYLPLAESLGTVQKDTMPLKFDALVGAIHALHSEVLDPDGKALIAPVAAAAEAMNGQTLDRQRELFKKLSAAMIVLVDTMPPSASVAESLFVVNCPMAKADWLQRTKDVANPYYAEEMKECGTVVRPVNSAKGAR